MFSGPTGSTAMHNLNHAKDSHPAFCESRTSAASPRRTARWRVKVGAVAALMCLAATTATTAHAAFGVYTLEAAWLGAVPAPTVIDFDNLADGTPVSNQYAGMNFAPFNGGVPIAAAESGPSSLFNVLSVDPLPNSAGGGVSIGFASPRHGMAFWYNDSQFAGNLATVYGTSNQVIGRYELAFPHPTEWRFVGFTSSDNDIARVDIAMGDGDRVTLDNVQFGAAAVPEPSAAALLLASMPLLWWIRRQTQRRATPRVQRLAGGAA